jgi:hypothetical protein
MGRLPFWSAFTLVSLALFACVSEKAQAPAPGIARAESFALFGHASESDPSVNKKPPSDARTANADKKP